MPVQVLLETFSGSSVKPNLNEHETNRTIISENVRGISDFMKGYQCRSNIVKGEK